MIKIKRIIAAAALSIFAFSAVGCEMIQKTPEAIKNTVLAKGDGILVTKGEVDELAVPYLTQQYGEDYASNSSLAEQVKQLNTQALTVLVEQKILEKKAEELGVKPSDDDVTTEVQKYLDNMKEAYGGEEGFNTALQGANMTLEDYTSQLTTSVKNQLISENVTNEIFKDINVTDEDISNYYDENKDSFGEANAEHILVSDEDKAKEIEQRLVNGEDFATVAKETSEDTGSKDKGGDLGVIPYNSTQYDADFLAGLKALKEGEISEPIKSQFGYHIIRATKVKEGSLEEAKDSIKTTLENQKKNDVYNSSIEQWKSDYKVKTYEDKL